MKNITVQAEIKLPLTLVWEKWTTPVDIQQWNSASPEWHTPRAENDLKAGGRFNYRMEARDGSFGFDFFGIYDTVVKNRLIEYTLGDDRKVKVEFIELQTCIQIVETFEAESENLPELQKTGWQAILNNFKKYCEEGG